MEADIAVVQAPVATQSEADVKAASAASKDQRRNNQAKKSGICALQ